MSEFHVLLEGRARRFIEHLGAREGQRVRAALVCLSLDPYRARSGCDVRKLRGPQGVWALRVGPFRAIYEVRGRNVHVTTIARRSTVYDR